MSLPVSAVRWPDGETTCPRGDGNVGTDGEYGAPLVMLIRAWHISTPQAKSRSGARSGPLVPVLDTPSLLFSKESERCRHERCQHEICGRKFADVLVSWLLPRWPQRPRVSFLTYHQPALHKARLRTTTRGSSRRACVSSITSSSFAARRMPIGPIVLSSKRPSHGDIPPRTSQAQAHRSMRKSCRCSASRWARLGSG